MNKRLLIVAAVVVLLAAGGGWLWMTRGQESTDDAQVEASVTPIAARVGGSVRLVGVVDNQEVEAGAVLVELDPNDYQVALDKAEAELADAEAIALAARTDVPITSTSTSSNVTSATGSVAQAEAGIAEAEQSIEAAKARLAAAQARLREQEANAGRAAKDVERFKSLLAKDEIAQQQYDAAVASAAATQAAAESARSSTHEAEAAIAVAQSRLVSSRIGRDQAGAGLRIAQTAPSQLAATRARAASAEARVMQARSALKQATLNLQYTRITAPVKGIVSRKSVEPGQVVGAGQPLMSIIPLENVWITANFKETQLDRMRPGQPVDIEVDAYDRAFRGKIQSIAAATGSRFSLLPPDNASGNFVKVVQRVPVKIVLDEGQDTERLLRPGMSVTPTVHTNQ